jgi:hypothetical protein
MPAVQLVRLKSEIAALNQSFSQPAVFYRRLYDFLETNSNRVYRAGQSVASNKQVTRFHVPPIIMNQLEAEIIQLSRLDRKPSLALVDQLGHAPYWEIKYLACCILGNVDPNPPEEVLQVLNTWLTPHLEADLQEMIFSKATLSLRSTYPQLWQRTIETWLENLRPSYQVMGLRALFSLAKDPSYDNLPFIYKLIRDPIIRSTHLLRPALLQISQVLMDRSPTETTFFIKQIITSAPLTARTIRLIRKMFVFFPSESQDNLRDLIKNMPVAEAEED